MTTKQTWKPQVKVYQLSLERPPHRFTDKEWAQELRTRKARNANYRLSYANRGIF